MSSVSVPNIFVPNTTIKSSQVNANFAALVAGFSSIDNSNVGVLGFYPSQLIPLTALQATFGGLGAYKFPAGLTVSGLTGLNIDNAVIAGGSIIAGGQITAGPSLGGSVIGPSSGLIQGPIQSKKAGGVTLATDPPLYNVSGGDAGTSSHQVGGKVTIVVNNGATTALTAITLAGDAQFTAEPFVTTSLIGPSVPGVTLVPSVPGWTGGVGIAVVSPSIPVSLYNTITLLAYSKTGTPAVSVANVLAYWKAQGI